MSKPIWSFCWKDPHKTTPYLLESLVLVTHAGRKEYRLSFYEVTSISPYMGEWTEVASPWQVVAWAKIPDKYCFHGGHTEYWLLPKEILPDTGAEVLCTVKYPNGSKELKLGSFKRSKQYPAGRWANIPKNTKVIAWVPIPDISSVSLEEKERR